MIQKILRIVHLVGLVVIIIVNISFGQDVEHNYKVGPQITTCDSLDVSDSSLEKTIQTIKSSKFRFQQSFKLTRRQGFKGGEYYSCDGESGFLVIKYNDEMLLFINVKKSIWDKLISSSDPEGYFLKERSSLQQYVLKE